MTLGRTSQGQAQAQGDEGTERGLYRNDEGRGSFHLILVDSSEFAALRYCAAPSSCIGQDSSMALTASWANGADLPSLTAIRHSQAESYAGFFPLRLRAGGRRLAAAQTG